MPSLALWALLVVGQSAPPVDTPTETPTKLSPEQILQRSTDVQSRLKTLSGKFQLAMPGAPLAQGRFRLSKPNYVEILGVPVEVRARGADLIQFDPLAKVVETRPWNFPEVPYLVGFEAFFGAPPERRVLGSDKVKLFRQEVHALNLIPPPGFRAFRIFIDPKNFFPLGWSMTDGAGRQASVKVSEVKPDDPMDPASFEWKEPAGTRLAEQVEIESKMLAVGEVAPPVVFDRVEGTDFRLADFVRRGRLTLVVFWNGSCDASRAAMPLIERWGQGYGNQVQLLAVNVGDSSSEVERLIRERGWSPASVLGGINSPAVNAFRVRAFPSVYLLSSDLKVQGRWVGWSQGGVTAAVQKAGIKPRTASGTPGTPPPIPVRS